MLVSCSNEDTYDVQSSNVENAQVITDLKNVNSELLSTVPTGTRSKEKILVVSADIGGAVAGGKYGVKLGGSVGMAFGNPITGGVFGAFLGAVIGGAYGSWLAAPASMVVADRPLSIEQVSKILINDDMSINESAIGLIPTTTMELDVDMLINRSTTRFSEPAATSKLVVDEELITESKLDEISLNIGKTHNIILSVMDGSVILQNEEQVLSDSSNLKEALFNSENFIEGCKVIGADASVGRLSTSDTMLNKVMELFNQVLEGYASKIDDVSFIIGKYVDVIEESNELTTEQKQCIKSGLATALYSFKYWESAF